MSGTLDKKSIEWIAAFTKVPAASIENGMTGPTAPGQAVKGGAPELDPRYGSVDTPFGRISYYSALRPDPSDLVESVAWSYKDALGAYDKLKHADQKIEAMKAASEHYDKLNSDDKFINSLKKRAAGNSQVQGEAQRARDSGTMTDALKADMLGLRDQLTVAHKKVQIAETSLRIEQARKEAAELAEKAKELAEGISKALHTVGNIIKVATDPESAGSWVDLATGLFDDFIKPAIAYSAKAEALTKAADKAQHGNLLAEVEASVESVKALRASATRLQPILADAGHNRATEANSLARHFDQGGSGGQDFSLKTLNSDLQNAREVFDMAHTAVIETKSLITSLNQLEKMYPGGLWSPESGAAKQIVAQLVSGSRAMYAKAEPVNGFAKDSVGWIAEFQKLVIGALADGPDGG